MNNSVFSMHEYVTVAVAFDKRTEPLAAYAADLATKLGKKLCLLHAVEPWLARHATPTFGIPEAVWADIPAIQQAAMKKATTDLDALKSMLEKGHQGLSIKTVVVEGFAPDALAKAAVDADSCLLVVGGAYNDVRVFPAGLSTGPALANMAAVPVMIVDPKPGQKPAPFERLRMLVADDLEPESDTALAFAATLAQAYRGAWVYHVHVSALTAEQLSIGLQAVASAARTSLSEGDIQTIVDATENAQRAKLEQRFSTFLEYLEASEGQYTADVIAGSTRNELSWVTKEFEPDILVFGRHKTVHKKPFSLGRMPYRQMLRLKRPIIIVPQD